MSSSALGDAKVRLCSSRSHKAVYHHGGVIRGCPSDSDGWPQPLPGTHASAYAHCRITSPASSHTETYFDSRKVALAVRSDDDRRCKRESMGPTIEVPRYETAPLPWDFHLSGGCVRMCLHPDTGSAPIPVSSRCAGHARPPAVRAVLPDHQIYLTGP